MPARSLRIVERSNVCASLCDAELMRERHLHTQLPVHAQRHSEQRSDDRERQQCVILVAGTERTAVLSLHKQRTARRSLEHLHLPTPSTRLTPRRRQGAEETNQRIWASSELREIADDAW